jgi:hypothetical protein
LEKLKEHMSDKDKGVDQYGPLREAAHEYFCTRNGRMGRNPHLRTLRFLSPIPCILQTDTNHVSPRAPRHSRATQEKRRWGSPGAMGT